MLTLTLSLKSQHAETMNINELSIGEAIFRRMSKKTATFTLYRCLLIAVPLAEKEEMVAHVQKAD